VQDSSVKGTGTSSDRTRRPSMPADLFVQATAELTKLAEPYIEDYPEIPVEKYLVAVQGLALENRDLILRAYEERADAKAKLQQVPRSRFDHFLFTVRRFYRSLRESWKTRISLLLVLGLAALPFIFFLHQIVIAAAYAGGILLILSFGGGARWFGRILMAIFNDRPTPEDAYFGRLSSQYRTLIETIVLRPALARAVAVQWGAPETDEVAANPAELGAKISRRQIVTTPQTQAVAIALSRPRGSAIGITGSRGAGKTELMRTFVEPMIKDTSTAPPIGIAISVASTFDSKSFLLRLLKELCYQALNRKSNSRPTYGMQAPPRLAWIALRVIGLAIAAVGAFYVLQQYRPLNVSQMNLTERGWWLASVGTFLALIGWRAAHARRGRPHKRLEHIAGDLLRRVEVAEKLTIGLDVGASVSGASARAAHGQELARLPLTEVDAIREIHELIAAIRDAGTTCIISVDELDKMPSDDDAIGFLNAIKVLFPTPDCSFIVSVSENAWSRFEYRGLPFRDAFDSSLDEVVRLSPLTPRQARDLLVLRDARITDLQALVCYCLSGGLPRDLVRSARHLATAGQDLAERGQRTLDAVLRRVLLDEVEAKIRAGEFRLREVQTQAEAAYIATSPMADLASWREDWKSPVRARARVQVAAAKYTARGSGPPSAAISPGAMILAEAECYFGLLMTVRDAFAGLGPATKLRNTQTFDQSLIRTGFQKIGEARLRMSIDIGSAWELLEAARNGLGLTTVGERIIA
jgi:hypothetical protein